MPKLTIKYLAEGIQPGRATGKHTNKPRMSSKLVKNALKRLGLADSHSRKLPYSNPKKVG